MARLERVSEATETQLGDAAAEKQGNRCEWRRRGGEVRGGEGRWAAARLNANNTQSPINVHHRSCWNYSPAIITPCLIISIRFLHPS